MKNKINVIDLDKTLIPYDSFRLLVKTELYKFDVYVASLVMFRKLKLIPNRKFKSKLVVHLTSKYEDDYFKKFAKKIYNDIDLKIINLVQEETDDFTVNVLLSASPNIFVRHLVKQLGWAGSGSYVDSYGKFIHLYGKEKIIWLGKTYQRDKYYYNFATSDSFSDYELLSLFNKNHKVMLRKNNN